MIAAWNAGLRRVLLPCAFLLFLLTEFAVFDQIGAHHHTGIYPRWNDQIQYLTESYTGYIFSQEHGWREGLWHSLVNPSAQGTLHDFFAVIIFELVGPSRSAALSINMLALLVWQTALFVYLLRRTSSAAIAWIGVALLLAVRAAWYTGPGSAFDFRLDWLATCLMGLTLVACVEAKEFRSTSGSAFFGFCVGLTLLTRFLTGAYFVPIFVILVVWLAFGKAQVQRRILNLLLSAAIAAVMAGPVLWLNRDLIYNYYVIGHLTGAESALRAPNWDLLTSLQWFGSVLLTQYLGVFALCLYIFGYLALRFSNVVTKSSIAPADNLGAPLQSLVPLVTFFAVPALVLILHDQKSTSVLGVALPALLMLLMEPILRVGSVVSQRWTKVVALALVSASMIGFVARMVPSPHRPDFLIGAQRINQFADMIARRCKLADLDEPKIAVDRLTDCLDGLLLRVLCYERQKTWLPVEMMLPMGIAEQPEEEILMRFGQSDFVVLTMEGPPGLWPADAQMDRLRPQVSAWAEAQLTPISQLDVFGMRFAVFAQQATPLEGDPLPK